MTNAHQQKLYFSTTYKHLVKVTDVSQILKVDFIRFWTFPSTLPAVPSSCCGEACYSHLYQDHNIQPSFEAEFLFAPWCPLNLIAALINVTIRVPDLPFYWSLLTCQRQCSLSSLCLLTLACLL